MIPTIIAHGGNMQHMLITIPGPVSPPRRLPSSPALTPRFASALPSVTRATMMAMAFGTMKEGEAVRLDCLSRTFAAEISEVRTSTGGLLAMVAVVTRGHVPRRELPPGERVTIYAADGSRWEGAIGGSIDSAASIILQQSTGLPVSICGHDGAHREGVIGATDNRATSFITQQSAGSQQSQFLLNLRDDEAETSRARMGIPLVDDNRADYLWRAKLAQHFGKYDEMLAAVNEISSLHLDLMSEEKDIVTCCYNGQLKTNWRVLKGLKPHRVQNLQHVPTRVVTGFTERIGHQLLEQCNDAFCLIEEHLLPFSSETNMAFYYKMMGDISWLALEAESDDRHALVNKAVSYYEMAIAAMMKTNASHTDASFLEVILNLSALLNDEVDSKSRARTLALTAVAAALGKTLSSESKAVVDLLNDNLESWLSHEQLVYQTLSVEIAQVNQEQGAELTPVLEVAPAVNLQDAQQVVVPLETPDQLLAQDAIDEDPQVPQQAMIPLEGLDLPPAQDAIDENEQVAQQVVVLHEAPDHLLAQDAIDEDPQVAQQVVVLHEAIDLPPAPQAANVQLPVPEAIGAQRAVPHRPRDSGVPLVFRHVPRPATLQFESPPLDKKIVGNAWHGKKFRREMKAKSAEKGKYGCVDLGSSFRFLFVTSEVYWNNTLVQCFFSVG